MDPRSSLAARRRQRDGYDSQECERRQPVQKRVRELESYFAEITRKQIRRGTLRNVSELIAAINAYANLTNADPKPLVWAAKANDILKKVARCRATLEAANQRAIEHHLAVGGRCYSPLGWTLWCGPRLDCSGLPSSNRSELLLSRYKDRCARGASRRPDGRSGPSHRRSGCRHPG